MGGWKTPRKGRSMHNNGGGRLVKPEDRKCFDPIKLQGITEDTTTSTSEAVIRLRPEATSSVIDRINWLKSSTLSPQDAADLDMRHLADGAPVYWEAVLASAGKPAAQAD